MDLPIKPIPLEVTREVKQKIRRSYVGRGIRDIVSRHKNLRLQNKPAAVIFDMSSTIISSHDLDIEAINTVLQLHGKPKWREGTRQLKEPKKSMKENFPNFFGAENAEKAYQEYINYLLERKERMPLIAGTIELLTFLKSSGIKVYIVSNRDRVFVDDMVKFHKIEHLIDGSIGAGDTPYTKPDPRIATSLLSEHKIDSTKEDVLFVGDALADIRCAEESYCVPVLLTEVITDMNPEFIRTRMASSSPKSMRVVPTLYNLHELVQQSLKPFKATIIGTGGKVVKKGVNLYNRIPNESLER